MGFLDFLGKAIDIRTAVGQAAQQLSAIDDAIETCRSLNQDDMIRGLTREIVQMDEGVWDVWKSRLIYKQRYDHDHTAGYMLDIGAMVHAEIGMTKQLLQYSIDDAVEIAVERIQMQSQAEALCFVNILRTYGETDLKADLIFKRTMKRFKPI